MSMKPVIIYTMARMRSNAAMLACKRQNKINEPFEVHRLMNIDPNLTKSMGYYNMKLLVSKYNGWDELIVQLNDPNSVVKMFGSSLTWLPHTLPWFESAQENNSHDIFMLVRQPKEVMFSSIIAHRFGWTKFEEKDPFEFTVSDAELYRCDLQLEYFLLLYPKVGTLVTFDTLPESHFDVSIINTEEQHSMDKKKFITNLDEVEEKINVFLKAKKGLWEYKTGIPLII